MAADLRVIETDRAACRASAVETLEAALADARDGRVVAVAVAVVRPQGGVNVAWSRSDDLGRLLGAASVLQHKLAASQSETT